MDNPEQIERAPAQQQALVNVYDPENDQIGSIPASQLADAKSQGFEEARPEQVDQYFKEEKYGTVPEQIKTGLEGAASAATFGLSTGIERGLGVKPEDIQGRREVNPGVHMAGQGIGLVGTAFIPGLGEANAAKALEGAGSLGAKAVGLGAAEGLAGKMGAGAVKAAVENALFQGGDEVSKMLSNDPYQSVDTAVANIGLAGLVGAGVGGVLGAVPPLWKATVGDRGGQFIEDFKGRINEHMNNPEPAGALTEELSNLYKNTTSVADEVYGPQGIKAQELQKLMPEMSEKISNQTQEINNKIGDTLKALKDDPHVRQLQDAVERYQSKITAPEAGSGDVFNAAQELKQQLQEWGKYNKAFSPLGERRFRDAAKDLAFELRNSLEESNVWGKAAERQKVINKAFGEYLPTLKDFEKKFTTEVAGDRVIDPGKVQTYVNQAGKMNGTLRREMLGNFIDAAEKYKNVIADSHATLGLENPIEHSSLNLAKSSLKELTPGAKFADALVNKGLGDVAGKGAGAVVGAGVGSVFGHSGIGALIGEHTLGHFFSSILPAIIKPVLESQGSAAALKTATDYGMQVIKGEALIGKGARAVFKSTREVLPAKSMEVSENDRDRLEKRMAELQKNPEKMLDIGGATGHYLPQHQTAMTETAGRVMQYLESVKPKVKQLAPLDAPIEPSKMEKSAYNRVLNIAEKPLSILGHIKENTLIPADVQALRAMYPSLYQKLSQQLTNEMIDHVSKEEPIPYGLKQSLSLFLGQPLDSTLTPQGIMAAQVTFQQQKANQSQGQGAPTKKGTSALKDAASQYLTREQANTQRSLTKS